MKKLLIGFSELCCEYFVNTLKGPSHKTIAPEILAEKFVQYMFLKLDFFPFSSVTSEENELALTNLDYDHLKKVIFT